MDDKFFLTRILHAASIDWQIAWPKITDGESSLLRLLCGSLCMARDALASDADATRLAKSIADETMLQARRAFADYGLDAGDTACCVVLSTVAWLLSWHPRVRATDLARRLFGRAGNSAAEYYDKHDPFTLLSPYEKGGAEWTRLFAEGRADIAFPQSIGQHYNAQAPPPQPVYNLIFNGPTSIAGDVGKTDIDKVDQFANTNQGEIKHG